MQKKKKIRFYLLLIGVMLPLVMWGKRLNTSYLFYIDKYKELAIYQQRRYHIPASITMAQALLESGAGTSSLARKSKNHFGIKTHANWRGKYTLYDDDKPKERFRVYSSIEDSYKDHAIFLQQPRYERLFKLKETDYKGWAKGLKKCGYATDRHYATRLIAIIQDYKLYRLDTKALHKNKGKAYPLSDYLIYKTYGLLYVYAKQGDSLEKIAYNLNMKEKDLYKYNEVPKGFQLQAGSIVYLQKKKRKADKPNYECVVRAGDSMYSISQQYGIRFKSLYKMNHKDYDYVPTEGDVLRLR